MGGIKSRIGQFSEMPSEPELLWQAMTDTQRSFVVARLSSTSNSQACRKVGIPRDTITKWNLDMIDAYIEHKRRNVRDAALFVMQESMLKAVGVFVEKLESGDAETAMVAAREILNRAGLPAVNRQEISGVSGGAIEVKAVDYRTGITALAPGSIPDSDTSG